MSFMVEDDIVLVEYNKIWNKIKEIERIKFHSSLVYDDKYIKAKVKELMVSLTETFVVIKYQKKMSMTLVQSDLLIISQGQILALILNSSVFAQKAVLLIAMIRNIFLLYKQKKLFSTSETFLNFRDFSQFRRLFSTSEICLKFGDFFFPKFICSLLGLNSYLNSHTCCKSKVISIMPQRALINSDLDAYLYYCLTIYKFSSKQ